jgi:serine/threonine-protein kinase
MIDQKIGRYCMLQKIGEGGMGVVYRARDSELKRDVAVKLLREDLSSDAQFIERFKREARVLASLNHPNIASIYGIEECDGVYALVMELVPGTSLSDRLGRCAIPLPEAMSIATQIAKALDYAHERSVIHRDLKPSNIKITPEGTVKLLDFGLAKTIAVSRQAAETESSTAPATSATEPGQIVGTAAYMSPEQARGDLTDKRTDIWAFGVVLFEMLTGGHAFAGRTRCETIAAVLKDQPNWALLPRTTPPTVRRLLARCLAKEPNERLRDIGDANLEIAEALTPPPTTDTEAPVSARISLLRRLAAWAVILLSAISLGAVLMWRFQPKKAGPRTHLAIPLPLGQRLTGPPAISADGRVIAWTSRTDTGRPLLYIRLLNEPEARLISGSEDANLPFFSPDGEWVAFFGRGRLMKAAVSGGSVTIVADAPDPWGGTWGQDGSIVFVPSFNTGLVKVSANGGHAETLTKPDGVAGGYGHMYPQFLADGKHVVFSVWSPVAERTGTALLSLADLRWELVLPEWPEVAYPVPGHLVAGDSGAGLRIAPLDAVHPAAVRVGRSIINQPIAFMASNARSWFAVSPGGTVVYAPADFTKSSLVWVDRNGRSEPVTAEEHDYWQPALSPEGERVAVRIAKDLWVYDLKRATLSRLTFSGYNAMPVWTFDGAAIVYGSNRGGEVNLYAQLASGATSARLLLKRDSAQLPCSVLRDGTVAFIDIRPETGRDLWALTPDGKASPFLVTPFNETLCRFSPDGHFMAYVSDESGRREVYVRPYPGPGEKVAISTKGGSYPVWSRDGRDLFFRQGESLMVVEVNTAKDFRATRERELFTSKDLGFRGEFDVSADGKRFLMVHREPGSWPSQLDVILNCLGDAPLKEAAR